MNTIEKLAVSLGALAMVRMYLQNVRAGAITAEQAMESIGAVLTTWERATTPLNPKPATRGEA